MKRKFSESFHLPDLEDDNASIIIENNNSSSSNNSDSLHSSGDNVRIPCGTSQHGNFNSGNTNASNDDDVQILEQTDLDVQVIVRNDFNDDDVQVIEQLYSTDDDVNFIEQINSNDGHVQVIEQNYSYDEDVHVIEQMDLNDGDMLVIEQNESYDEDVQVIQQMDLNDDDVQVIAQMFSMADDVRVIEQTDANDDDLQVIEQTDKNDDDVHVMEQTVSNGNDVQYIRHTDSTDEVVQVINHKENWTELPSLAVENIYSFLSRTDQSRMSQVCTRWSKDFSSPAVWKTIKFYLPEHHYSSEIYPEVKFARKYGCMFRHVEIICKIVRNRLVGVIWRQLSWFLQAMTSLSQVTSIKFINMGNYFRRLDDILYEDLFTTIIRFFHSQKNIKTVVFQDSRFGKYEASDLLKAIFHSNSTTLTNLTLRGFVRDAPFNVAVDQYIANLSEVCHRISKVQTLELDYTQMFEDIINALHVKLSTGEYQPDKKKPNLASINIFCDGKNHSWFRGILPETWKYLAKVFPYMKVKMEVTILSHLKREMEKFLVKEIPLQTLDFIFEKISAPARIGISTLLTHLQMCKYQDHLCELSVLWVPPVADFAGSVITFVQSCNKLETLHLRAKCDPTGIENVLQALLQYHPETFKSITIWSNGLRGYDQENLTALSEEYYSLYNAAGLQCFLVVDQRLRRLEGRQ